MMSSLFSWVWDLLYGISKSMYAIIDNLMACANMLCGIDPIKYQGQETDFLSFLMRNERITYAFVGSVLVAVFLVFIFAVFAILRTIASEKIEKTPSQIFISVGKTLLTFLFIPAAMTVLIYFTNIIMRVLYDASLGGSTKGIGSFLAGAFGQNALKDGVDPNFYLAEDFNYMSTSQMKSYVDLSDYDYFFSWLASIIILIAIGSALLMFVDRAIAIIILFVVSPISLSTAILDDGARFKLWRDQFLVKFLTGYGCIIGINIYALVVAAVTNDGLVFFEKSVILNNMMKILIIGGGGVSLNRLMALIGNLISAGAGSNELRDNAIAASSFAGKAGAAMMMPLKAAKGMFGATRSAINFANDSKNQGLTHAVGSRMGFKTSRDYAMERAHLSRGQGFGAANNQAGVASNNIGAGNNNAKNAILGGANPTGNQIIGGGNNPQGNNNNNKNIGNDFVNDAVKNSMNKDQDKGNNKK